MQNNNDIYNELHTNFIEYSYAFNTDRAIPSAADGLKPVAKRILYSCAVNGRNFSKPHVKSARIVGDVMGELHPHGDSSIYDAMVRLSQDWIMRYPLIDWHGNNGNIVGDGPAASRYTEARLSQISEDGLLSGLKKRNVDFIPNYDETSEEPVVLPSIFPNLLCNPTSGIGIAMACKWAPHNLNEVAKAINDYIDGKEPMLPGPDFPTGGIVINKNDIPAIMASGHGTVKIRGQYKIEKGNIVFYEIPYGTTIEGLVAQIGDAAEEIENITDVRDETNKKGVRIVIECSKNPEYVVKKLFAKTDLQFSFAYNQIALIGKTPTELNLTDCCRIYVEHNNKCIVREAEFDIDKTNKRLHIIAGLIKAIAVIDEIIAMIRQSSSAAAAKETLINKWKFSEEQATAILDMKLSKLAKLEEEELKAEEKGLQDLLVQLIEIKNNPTKELQKRLTALVNKYGDPRRTVLLQINEPQEEEKEIVDVEPEQCMVIMTESGYIKRIPVANFRAQKRAGLGVKTQDDITIATIRTNTVDKLLVFTDKGMLYRLLVNDIPVGTNATKGTAIMALIDMEADEKVETIYSVYRGTEAQFVLFVTRNGIIKKTPLNEYVGPKKKNGLAALKLKDGDSLVAATIIKDENVLLASSGGKIIRLDANDIGISSRTSTGVKGMGLGDNEEIVAVAAIRDPKDDIALFTENGYGKRLHPTEFTVQGRGGKGIIGFKVDNIRGPLVDIAMVNDEDLILLSGTTNAICIPCSSIPVSTRAAKGVIMIKDNKIVSVSKV